MSRAGGSRLARLITALGFATLTGCAGHLSKGESAYDDGEYPEAKRQLLLAENDSASWPPKTIAEYALYRGLTFEALGDRAEAAIWLDKAKALDDARPGTLSRDNRVRLDLAWRSVSAPYAAPTR